MCPFCHGYNDAFFLDFFAIVFLKIVLHAYETSSPETYETPMLLISHRHRLGE